jgi:IstB-like ATP binding protein
MKCRLLEGLRMVDRADDLLPCRQEVTRRVQRMGEVFGDDSVAVAMIERLVHHAEILSLKGDSYRLKDRDLGPRPARTPDTT